MPEFKSVIGLDDMPDFDQWESKDLKEYLDDKLVTNIPASKDGRITACFFAYFTTLPT